MKQVIVLITACFLNISCAVSQKEKLQYKSEIDENGQTTFNNGTVTISNPDIEYEVVIFDNYFENWMWTRAKPRGYYSKSFLEAKNRIWVTNFNNRSRSGNTGIFYTIDYQSTIDYGYEVNYMLYHYLLYFQETNKVRLD